MCMHIASAGADMPSALALRRMPKSTSVLSDRSCASSMMSACPPHTHTLATHTHIHTHISMRLVHDERLHTEQIRTRAADKPCGNRAPRPRRAPAHQRAHTRTHMHAHERARTRTSHTQMQVGGPWAGRRVAGGPAGRRAGGPHSRGVRAASLRLWAGGRGCGGMRAACRARRAVRGGCNDDGARSARFAASI